MSNNCFKYFVINYFLYRTIKVEELAVLMHILMHIKVCTIFKTYLAAITANNRLYIIVGYT